jgi:hypothetical protein
VVSARLCRFLTAPTSCRKTFLKSDLSGRTIAERTARKPFGEQRGGVVGLEQAKYGPALSGRGWLSGAQCLPYVAEEAEKHRIVDHGGSAARRTPIAQFGRSRSPMSCS